jgi:hypothetical protein
LEDTKRLLEEDPSLIDSTPGGYTPLFILVKNGVGKWPTQVQALQPAAIHNIEKKRKEKLELIKLLVNKKPLLLFQRSVGSPGEITRGDTLPIHVTLWYDDIEMFEALISCSHKQFDIKTKHRENLAHLASFYDAIKCLTSILEKAPHLKKEVTIEGYNLAHCAVQAFNSHNCLKYILKTAPELFKQKNLLEDTPLHMATRLIPAGRFNRIKKRIMEKIKEITEHNNDYLYLQGGLGILPIHSAQCAELVNYYIQKDGNLINQKDNLGNLPSFYSADKASDIIYAWYGLSPKNKKTKYINNFITSLKEKTPLDTFSANCILKYYEPFWPEELTQMILLYASPQKAHQILSSPSKE